MLIPSQLLTFLELYSGGMIFCLCIYVIFVHAVFDSRKLFLITVHIIHIYVDYKLIANKFFGVIRWRND